MSRTHDEVEVNVQLQPGMEPQVQYYARDKVTAVLGHTDRPVLFARVRLDQIGNPAADRPVTARAEIDLNGRVLHAEAHGDTPYEALDLMQDRLQSRLDRQHAHEHR
ncbi:HPF/RaiA family ribosome-associated protein [Dactylosporangium vinaceum]|uniref:HPF/RaiA family ribosome-associated protein n=1 Tax=Dactylosporangium vinaceum TaxID=53362 RepID=A0ABV5MCW6_9ACTN|nr:HPF/RaiA family ribosome-associated protein [Dactylosporangium vinaceum]UAC00753.1 HPF/RaiA family ribosome-associated protein [Dactylosporangium vinaceum]